MICFPSGESESERVSHSTTNCILKLALRDRSDISTMRLDSALLVAIAVFLATCSSVCAATSTKGIAVGTSSSIESLTQGRVEGSNRSLRAEKPSIDDVEDEERGYKSAVEALRKASYKALFPGWLLAGKKPAEIREKLKITYPYVEHQNWKILKSYKKAYDKLQNTLHPSGM
ncbi:hypothetical protein PHYPSEUDO_001696 [Phytophthora pseudosyringae]|uniref:RxLR effector protein n=1 Tax=Phytophthora pseudosyringae TaxID=221518 RepID=A0A8T1VVD4_9STRA|nr:hypothetical protein PHYPSEUDO_001696 [Phytophthora pseudosyringae]